MPQTLPFCFAQLFDRHRNKQKQTPSADYHIFTRARVWIIHCAWDAAFSLVQALNTLLSAAYPHTRGSANGLT
jgi:hypothetical protein